MRLSQWVQEPDSPGWAPVIPLPFYSSLTVYHLLTQLLHILTFSSAKYKKITPALYDYCETEIITR